MHATARAACESSPLMSARFKSSRLHLRPPKAAALLAAALAGTHPLLQAQDGRARTPESPPLRALFAGGQEAASFMVLVAKGRDGGTPRDHWHGMVERSGKLAAERARLRQRVDAVGCDTKSSPQDIASLGHQDCSAGQ